MLLKDMAEIIFSFPEKGPADDTKWIYAACLQEDNKIIELKQIASFRLLPSIR